MLYANVFNKWLHLTSAAVFVGGMLYLLVLLLPLVRDVPEALRRDAFRKTFRIQMWAILILLLTGLDNVFRARKTLGWLSPDEVSGWWTAFWIKAALFVLAFALVHALALPMPLFRRLQEEPKRPVMLLLLAGLVIIALSGYMTLTRLSVLSGAPPPRL